MKRFGPAVIGVVVTIATAGAAYAQPAERPWSVQADAAATFGNASSSSFGVEVDRRLNSNWDVTLEAGRMGNVTSSATDDRAAVIGTQIAATPNAVQTAIYWDLGLRYRLMPDGAWNPYVALGFGGAHIDTSTTFSANGVQLSDQDLAARLVALGADLDGTITKPFLTIGVGVTRPFAERYFLDASYRYGRVFPRTGEIDGDKANNTQRLQLGIGIRF
jgi:opacity protein-like surface antigen